MGHNLREEGMSSN